ncbi:unnamed protein product [Spirodela intermedia]|uniref:Uncharacterized protein n=1 Tax=Spirodela intermedia TaxID=51605 RepID=A0A7I8LKR5_SPIIN|nr:unnamed protein product [Spirodela intermedia]
MVGPPPPSSARHSAWILSPSHAFTTPSPSPPNANSPTASAMAMSAPPPGVASPPPKNLKGL